jgi:hypothetical protein
LCLFGAVLQSKLVVLFSHLTTLTSSSYICFFLTSMRLLIMELTVLYLLLLLFSCCST